MGAARVQEVEQQVFVDPPLRGRRVPLLTLPTLSCRLVALSPAGTVVDVAVVAPGDVSSTAVAPRREERLVLRERLRVWSNPGVAQPSALAPPATGARVDTPPATLTVLGTTL
jgi:hypothetical protein